MFIGKTRSGRFISSIRQVVGAEGGQVVTNEIFKPDQSGRAVPGIAPPHELAVDLEANGWDRRLFESPEGWWS